MASYDTNKSRGVLNPPPGPGWSRQLVTDVAIVEMTTPMLDNANDDVGLMYVEAGTVVVSTFASFSDMDSSTSLVIDIGDTGDEDRFVAATTLGVAGGTITGPVLAGALYKYTARQQLRAFINTAAGVAAAGTLKFAITYFIDPEFSTTAQTAS